MSDVFCKLSNWVPFFFIIDCFGCLHVAHHLVELKCREKNKKQLSDYFCLARPRCPRSIVASKWSKEDVLLYPQTKYLIQNPFWTQISCSCLWMVSEKTESEDKDAGFTFHVWQHSSTKLHHCLCTFYCFCSRFWARLEAYRMSLTQVYWTYIGQC